MARFNFIALSYHVTQVFSQQFANSEMRDVGAVLEEVKRPLLPSSTSMFRFAKGNGDDHSASPVQLSVDTVSRDAFVWCC